MADDAFAAEWGDLGPVYGKQWVDWPTFVPGSDGSFRRGPGVNQIAALVEGLRHNPGSRRHIFTGWNVAELDRMALPPCHMTYQFHVSAGRLSGMLWQRSCDLGLGFAFNVFEAALLIRMLAAQTRSRGRRADLVGRRLPPLPQPRRPRRPNSSAGRRPDRRSCA